MHFQDSKERIRGIVLLFQQRQLLRQLEKGGTSSNARFSQVLIQEGIRLAFGSESEVFLQLQRTPMDDLDELINSAVSLVSVDGYNHQLDILDSLELLRRDLVLLERENQAGAPPGSLIKWWDSFAHERLTAVNFNECANDLASNKSYVDEINGPASRLGRRRLIIDRWIDKICRHGILKDTSSMSSTIMAPCSNLQSKEVRDKDLATIAVLTIIGPELKMVKTALQMNENDRVLGGGNLHYEKVIDTKLNGQIKVQLHVAGQAGNISAAGQAQRIISGGARFMLLCGIAAGLRDKVKIADVVVPRCIVDATIKVAEGGQLQGRPKIVSPLQGVQQMNACMDVDLHKWHTLFDKLVPTPIIPPSGKSEEYSKNVAVKPKLYEAALLSDDLLLRDPQSLVDAANAIHQQIRAAEMEAAGFVQTCMDNHPPIPWYVVRGISDFGDDLKDDCFHTYAAAAAAAYVAVYIDDVLDLRIWD